MQQTGREVDDALGVSRPLRHAGRLKPVFSANHRWAMARGEDSLRLEVRGAAPLT